MKLAVKIGHTSKSKGAYSKYFDMREYDFYKEVVKCLDSDIDVYEFDSSINGYTARQKKLSEEINKYNYDLVMELHFNAFNKEADGCLTLFYYRSVKGKKYAEEFSKTVSLHTGINNDGIKPLNNRYDRGFAGVYYPKAPAILIEPFFGDNLEDCAKIGRPEKIAQIINCFKNENRL